ncbi:hypothetical protein BS47DRAFT_1371160 [Hydnum rufescens UP504]|uniref:G-alpha-domain-containing protein n=1 Tax=Hydnum rufescens UP504 TaxID=1448309 RepID=A0A9P6B683_9AGAM|nr:hypothetical protein BS47DRAFT_1371160 [Hydnum rufescens UP504]
MVSVRQRSNRLPPDNLDPLTVALRPPPGETPDERAARLREGANAKAISDKIDEQIRLEREEINQRKKNGDVKILLLGQSESGKSTTIKNFQMLYSPQAWRQEHISWRAVIYLNLVLPDAKSPLFCSRPIHSRSVGPTPTPRLAPLTQVETLLIRALSPENPTESDFEATHLGTNQPDLLGRTKAEVFVSASRWRNTLKSKMSKGSLSSIDVPNASTSSESGGHPVNKPDIVGILRTCRQDMLDLWNDPLVQNILTKRRVRPQDSSGFFLNDISRLMERDYLPTDQDVLNARLKTLGSSEHVFRVDRGSEKGINWTVYDVGGARNQRHVWTSFFDNVDSIIFLAPISAFNQVLSEDPSVNRIADSLLLFRAICGNKLLQKVNIVLFLNKVDLLQAKLGSGIQLKKYMLSYGDKPNDLENACKYFKSKFGAAFRELSDVDRELYIHFTTMNDPKSTSSIINNVREMILRKALHKSSLI